MPEALKSGAASLRGPRRRRRVARNYACHLTEGGLVRPKTEDMNGTSGGSPCSGWGRRVPMPRASARARQQWREARSFQDKAQRLFKEPTTAFFEWLLLETLQELIDERGDAVSQAELARRSGLSQRVVSYWIPLMSEMGFVDRAPDADGRAWRLLLTDLGERTVRACNERLEAAGLTR